MTEQKMNDLPRKTLCEIVAKYGKSICDDDRRCEGLLRDLCSGYKRETTVLLSAMRERIPYELLSNSIAGVTMEVTIARLSKRLHDDLAMTFEAARWAVESWALALGVITETEVSRSAANYTGRAPTTSRTVPAPKPQSWGGHDPSQSPEIRGFRLGMSLQEVLKQFNGLQVPSADEVGFQKIELTVAESFKELHNSGGKAYVSSAVSSSLNGLTLLEFQFLDGQVSSIRITYDRSVKWNSLEEFAKKTSEVLGLSGTWQGGVLAMQTYRIQLQADYRGTTLHLQDIQAERLIKERTAAIEDHKRHTFDL